MADKRIIFESEKDMPELPISISDTLYNKTGSWRNMKPVIENKAAPCTKACPAGNLIPVYLDLILRGKIEEAAKVILKTDPIPSITGRVCTHPCEIGCNRRRYDEPISIRSFDRFLGDYYLDKKGQPPKEETGKKIAVVGSGPAGMTAAYYLREKGHSVIIFEKSDRPGGVLMDGIPEYRLPKEIVWKEFKALERMGIVIKYNIEVGKDVGLDELLKEYDAVFVATGAPIERKMRIPGEEHFINGLEFLREVNRGNRKPPGKKVAVIGGGNVAMDVARSLLRIGAIPVILYRRTRKEMPAIEEEVDRALEDGIEFKFLTLPVKAERKNGKLILTNIKMQLGEPDKSGRRRPIPIEGSEYEEEYDAVITAIGELADTSIFPKETLDENGWLIADRKTAATKIKGLFAGGDLVEGPSLVVKAIAWGRAAANSIDLYVRGVEIPSPEKPPRTVAFNRIVTEYFPHLPRIKQRELRVEERIKSFDAEEVLGYTEEEAKKEALRCFSCGYCNSCGNCWVYCPDSAIKWVNGYPEVDYDYCKGCGICARECPRGVIEMVRERIF